MKKFLLVLCCFLFATVVSPVFATPMLSLFDENPGSIPGPNNNLLQGIFGADSVEGFYGAEVMFTGSGNITFEYLGSEAGFTNNFFYGNELLFSNHGLNESSVGEKVSYSIDKTTPTFLNFFFGVDNTNSLALNQFNPDGSSVNESTLVNFFVAWDTNAIGKSMVLFLDDNPSNDDDDHDDMAVRISVVPVPEPAAMILFGIGLLGLAGVSRRKK